MIKQNRLIIAVIILAVVLMSFILANAQSQDDFSLVKIGDVYEQIENGEIKEEELVFLDENFEEIEVDLITKEKYKGEIYDVDVENDVVLVRRGLRTENSELRAERGGIWSGNSENDTHVYDWSGNDNNGTGIGAVVNTSGKFGGAFTFDGVDDYVSVSDDDSLDLGRGDGKELTVSLWYYAKGISTSYQTIFAKSSTTSSAAFDYGILTNSNKLYFATGSSNGVCAWMDDVSEPSRNEWHHIVGTLVSNGVQTGTKELYVDGNREFICNYSYKSLVNEANINFGQVNTNDWNFNGSIDEVAIYNRSLSASEIHALFLAGNATRQNITESNWTSPILDAGQTGVNWTTIEWDAVQDSRANVSRTSELDYDKNMVLWMHFNNDSSVGENDTHVYDFSGNGNNGSVVGATYNASGGKFGGAFEFDGEGDYVNIGLGSDFSNLCVDGCSFSAWVNPIDDGTVKIIIGRWDGSTDNFFKLAIDQLDRYQFNIYDDGVTAPCLTFAEGATYEWQHLVGVYNNVTNRTYLYKNGLEIDNTICSFSGVNETAWQDSEPTQIGIRRTDIDHFNGSIDEVAIWNRSLTAEEIRNLYYEDVVKFQTRTATTSAGIDSATWSDYLAVDGSEQGLGLCVAENSMILMSDGTRKKITEIKAGDMVMSVGGVNSELRAENLELVSNKVLKLFDMGYKPIYELTTESGKAINTTGNHPYLVRMGTENSELRTWSWEVWDWILGKLKW